MYEVKEVTRQGIRMSDIYLTKGDTFLSTVTAKRKNTGETYVPVEGDVVRFALKKAYTDSESLVRKVIPIDTMLLRIDADETKNLPVRSYVYDIEITFVNGEVDTFIRGNLILLNEVE